MRFHQGAFVKCNLNDLLEHVMPSLVVGIIHNFKMERVSVLLQGAILSTSMVCRH